MQRKKPNKWPLFCFVIGLAISIWAFLELERISSSSSTNHFFGLIAVVASASGAMSVVGLLKLIRNDFFAFLKLKRFQFSFWAVAVLVLGFFVYINNAHDNVGMLIINTFFLCLSIIFLGRVVWKISEDIGDGIPDNDL